LLLLISIQLSLRYVYIEISLTARGGIPDVASNEHSTGSRGISTSSSRKPLSHDTDNPIELYAWSVSQIHVAKKPGMLEVRVINPDFR